jgi:hypothetical protein
VQEGQQVNIVAAVQGENWLVGSQTWVSSTPAWATEWLQLDDGSYVYGAFIFRLGADETSPLIDPGGAEKWITSACRANGGGDGRRPGDQVSRRQRSASRRRRAHYIEPTAALCWADDGPGGGTPGRPVRRRAGSVHQYIDQGGRAARTTGGQVVFGTTPTSHGCVGLQLHDAQYFWLFGEPGMRVEVHP